uniref:Tgc002 n=1 Tax=Toxoplasma gondii TaxID=5811 RepID=Q5SGD9_TOXGO|nr:tgc002 [Toxoplasma gondii]
MVPGLFLCLVAITVIPQAALICIGASVGELEEGQASRKTPPYGVVEDNGGGHPSKGVKREGRRLPRAVREAGLSWFGIYYGLHAALYLSVAWGAQRWGDQSALESRRALGSAISLAMTWMGSMYFALMLHDVYLGTGREQALKIRKSRTKMKRGKKKKRRTKKAHGTG